MNWKRQRKQKRIKLAAKTLFGGRDINHTESAESIFFFFWVGLIAVGRVLLENMWWRSDGLINFWIVREAFGQLQMVTWFLWPQIFKKRKETKDGNYCAIIYPQKCENRHITMANNFPSFIKYVFYTYIYKIEFIMEPRNIFFLVQVGASKSQRQNLRHLTYRCIHSYYRIFGALLPREREAYHINFS